MKSRRVSSSGFVYSEIIDVTQAGEALGAISVFSTHRVCLCKLICSLYVCLLCRILEKLPINNEKLTVLHGFDNFSNCGLFGFAFQEIK